MSKEMETRTISFIFEFTIDWYICNSTTASNLKEANRGAYKWLWNSENQCHVFFIDFYTLYDIFFKNNRATILSNKIFKIQLIDSTTWVGGTKDPLLKP
jgi:hypothetical protein